MFKNALSWVGGCLVLGGCLSLSSLGPDTENPEYHPYDSSPAQRARSEPDVSVSSARSDHTDPGLVSARRAVEAALPFLQQDGMAWMEGRVPIQEGRACVSCHHVPFAVWSHAEAARAGLEVGASMPDLTRRAVEFLGRPGISRALNVAPVLLGPVGSGPLSEAWASAAGGDLVAELLGQRERSGGWRARGQFPTQRRPVSESDEVATMWSLLALRGHGGSDRAAVANEFPTDDEKTIEWLAAKALVSLEISPESSPQSTVALIDAQNSDGGWPWASGEVSNAYSTGQALYALSIAGGDHSGLNDVLNRARRYLVQTQGHDGTWRVPSALISQEGNSERDVIYHYWGTAWAVIGLARSL